MNFKAACQNELFKIGALILLVFIAYSSTLSAPFKTLDDELAIVHNEKIQNIANWPQLFTSSYFGLGDYYRPVVFLSYMLDYHLFGINPFFYYLVNLILHSAVGILVYKLLGLFFDDKRITFFAALLFVVHPLQWVAVSTLTGRNTLLYGLFYLSSFLSFCYFVKNKRFPFYAASLMLFILALLSREASITLPLMVAAYVFLMRPQEWKRDGCWVLPYVFIVLGYFFFRKAMGFLFLLEQKRGISEVVLSFAAFLKSFLDTLRLIAFPTNLHFDRSTLVFSGFTDGVFIMTVIAFLAAKYFFFQKRKNLPPAVQFFIVWIFLELIPVSQVIAPILIQPGYISTGDHMFYVSSVGIFVFLVYGLAAQKEKVARKFNVSSGIVNFCLAGVFAFWFLMTVKQGIISSSELALHRQTLNVAPYNVRIRRSYAAALIKYGLYEELEQEFRILLQDDPSHAEFRIGLGKSLIDQGKIKEGIAEYQKIQAPGIFTELLQDNLQKAQALLKETSAH